MSGRLSCGLHSKEWGSLNFLIGVLLNANLIQRNLIKENSKTTMRIKMTQEKEVKQVREKGVEMEEIIFVLLESLRKKNKTVE